MLVRIKTDTSSAHPSIRMPFSERALAHQWSKAHIYPHIICPHESFRNNAFHIFCKITLTSSVTFCHSQLLWSTTYVAKVMAQMSLATVECEDVIEGWFIVERIERTFPFLGICYSAQSVSFWTMCPHERKELEKTMVTHHIRCCTFGSKKSVNYFASHGIPRQTVPTTTPTLLPRRLQSSSSVQWNSSPNFSSWWLVCEERRRSVYVHRSKTVVRTVTYLNECIRKRLIPFINKHHKVDQIFFLSDLASAHETKQVQAFLANHGIERVRRPENPPNVSQLYSIETIWILLE